MTFQVVPLHQDIHRHIRLNTQLSFAEFSDRHLFPVSVHEFSRASTEYPVVFVKDSETGQFKAVILLGLMPGENLYAAKGAVQPNYLPQALQNYPLVLMADPNRSGQFTIGLHTTSVLVNESEGQALFDAQGQETPYLQKRKQALIQSFEQQQVTDAFAALLAEMNLLQAQSFSVEIQGQTNQLNGIYVISESVLQQLPVAQFDDLRQRGFLPSIYAQLNSLYQFNRLAARKAAVAG